MAAAMLTTMITLLAFAAPGRALTAPRLHPDFVAIWCYRQSPVLCMRDPSNGGLGTQVVNSGFSMDESEQFRWIDDSSRCGGKVSGTCPFNDPALDIQYQNDLIIVLKQVDSGDCIGASAASGWLAMMKTCDTGSEPSTAFVAVNNPAGTDYFSFISIDNTNANGCCGVLTGNPPNDGPVAVENVHNSYSEWIAQS